MSKEPRDLTPEMRQLLKNLLDAGRPLTSQMSYPKHPSSSRMKINILHERGYVEHAGMERMYGYRDVQLWRLTEKGRKEATSPPPVQTHCIRCEVNPKPVKGRICYDCIYKRQISRKAVRLATGIFRTIPRKGGERCNCPDTNCTGVYCTYLRPV